MYAYSCMCIYMLGTCLRPGDVTPGDVFIRYYNNIVIYRNMKNYKEKNMIRYLFIVQVECCYLYW